MMTAEIGIFGTGAWGTALAMAWGAQGIDVALWGHPPEFQAQLARDRRHPRLPDAQLPPSVRVLMTVDDAFCAPLWVSALPTQISPAVWRNLAAQTRLRPELLIHVSKGILLDSHRRLSQELAPILSVPVGVLSGPSFADEVAKALPTALVLALPESVSDARAEQIQALLATPRLRPYLSRDVTGVELCGAFKNILAIAAGLVESLGLGNNARAALLTRGLKEMSRLVERMGGSPETVAGLAGSGDLFLTATGQSRNRRLGNMVGSGMTPRDALNTMGEQVVEGVATAEAALLLAKELDVELPITQEVVSLLRGADPHVAVERLMQRSLKTE